MPDVGELLRQAEGIVAKEFGREFASPAPIFKVSGQAMGATVSFNHRGPAETVSVKWSIAPGSIVPGVHQEDESRWVEIAKGSVSISGDASLVNYTIDVTGVWPATLPAAGFGYSWDKADCRVEIFRGTTSLLMKWWDGVYAAVEADFRDLSATFT